MKKFLFYVVALFLLLFTAASAQFGPQEKILDVKTYKSFDKVHPGSELKVALEIDIDGEWHINSHKPNDEFLIGTEIEIDSAQNFSLVKINYPEGENKTFSFSEEPVSVYEGKLIIPMLIRISEDAGTGVDSFTVNVNYQSCNDNSCLPPDRVSSVLPIEIADKSEPIQAINNEIFETIDLEFSEIETPEKAGNEDSLTSTLEESGLILALLIAFVGGLALNLTPCVYPLIPITVGYFGGQSEGRTGKLLLLGIFYVLGMALTYSLIGVITSLSGAVFGALLQNTIVILFIAAVLFALSLSMFGVYEFKLPDKWVMKAGGAKSGGAGAFLMGLTMGVVAAPCIGPFVLGLVTVVAAKGDPLYGFAMFFSLAVGLGTPYIFLAVFSGKIKNLPKAGFWMEAVKHIFGFILLGMGLYFLLPLIPESIRGYVLPAFMIIAAVFILFFDKKGNEILGFRIFKIVFSVALLFLSAYMLWPVEKSEPEWEKFTMDKYEGSLGNSAMVIDFYADWCIPCKELDALTFSDSEVINKMNTGFTAYKVDMTKAMSEETQQVRKRFEVVGVPTVLIIDSEGNIVERITGFLPPEEFIKKLNKI